MKTENQFFELPSLTSIGGGSIFESSLTPPETCNVGCKIGCTVGDTDDKD